MAIDTGLSQAIFREYDIRGIVGQDLTERVGERIGRAFGTFLRRKGGRFISLARDGRIHSPGLRDAFLKGLLSTGVDCVDLGICPTPLLYFSLFHLPVDGGGVITGSHNSADYNGFKLCVGKEALYGEEIQAIRALIEAGESEKGEGSVSFREIIPDYIRHLTQDFHALLSSNKKKRIRVVVDSGNGTAGLVAPSLLEQLGCEVIPLYSDLDGHFPHHHPDPTLPENLTAVKEAVAENRADCGVAYDGDADRLGVVDDKGGILWGDQLMIIFARDILETRPGAPILSEVKASQVLFDEIAKRGGDPIMWRTGHSLIKAKMKEAGALLAGEMSGHLFFADRYFGYDDAIYASCRLLEVLAKKGVPLSELLQDLPRTVSTPEIRIFCPDKTKFHLVEEIKKRFSRTHPVIDIDGARVQFEGGWGLVRASNTQPALVLRYEAVDEAVLATIRNQIEGALREVGIPL